MVSSSVRAQGQQFAVLGTMFCTRWWQGGGRRPAERVPELRPQQAALCDSIRYRRGRDCALTLACASPGHQRDLLAEHQNAGRIGAIRSQASATPGQQRQRWLLVAVHRSRSPQPPAWGHAQHARARQLDPRWAVGGAALHSLPPRGMCSCRAGENTREAAAGVAEGHCGRRQGCIPALTPVAGRCGMDGNSGRCASGGNRNRLAHQL